MGLVVAAAVLATASGLAPAKESPTSNTVSLAQLPAEAQTTRSLIRSGGPFPFPKDGVTFGNRERLLPVQPRGFYREYTVQTPGAHDRGARRIVCGGARPERPDACYYTANHYATFQRIAP